MIINLLFKSLDLGNVNDSLMIIRLSQKTEEKRSSVRNQTS